MHFDKQVRSEADTSKAPTATQRWVVHNNWTQFKASALLRSVFMFCDVKYNSARLIMIYFSSCKNPRDVSPDSPTCLLRRRRCRWETNPLTWSALLYMLYVHVSVLLFLRCCQSGILPSLSQQCWWSLWLSTWSSWWLGCGSDSALRLVLVTVSLQPGLRSEAVSHSLIISSMNTKVKSVFSVCQRTSVLQTVATAVQSCLYLSSASDWLKCATVNCQPCVHVCPICAPPLL